MLRMIPIVLCGLAFDGPLEFEVLRCGRFRRRWWLTTRRCRSRRADLTLRQIAGVAYNIQGVRVGETTSDIFEAVQEQLGLKLEGKKGTVEVLIVDHAEKASEN
jgi:hypothetical protein